MIRLFALSLATATLACSSDLKGLNEASTDAFADIPVIPYIPDLALTVVTGASDRKMILAPVPGSAPEQHMGTGKALVKIKNNTAQVTTGILSLDKASDSFFLTTLEICQSDALKNCIDVNGLSLTLNLSPGQELYFTIHVEASGSIGFAPVANAIKLFFQGTGDDALTSLSSNIPIINEN